MQFPPPLPLNCAGRTKSRGVLNFYRESILIDYDVSKNTGGKFFYFSIKIKIRYWNQFGMICISIITRVKLRYYTSLNRVVIL